MAQQEAGLGAVGGAKLKGQFHPGSELHQRQPRPVWLAGAGQETGPLASHWQGNHHGPTGLQWGTEAVFRHYTATPGCWLGGD